jgi:hypothetical protein
MTKGKHCGIDHIIYSIINIKNIIIHMMKIFTEQYILLTQ